VPLALYAIAPLPAITLDMAGAVAGILLFAGLWTPVAGAVMAITELWIAFTQSGDLWAHVLLATIGAGLAMLGPGAWSVDSRLFGRKRFHIGSRSHPP
jgi:putative oxidoreductase